MNIVFIGKPGSGKGTSAQKLANDLNYKLVIAGDLLREERNSGSVLGKEIKKLIDKGNLVPDDVISKIIYNEINKPIKIGKFHIMDGYPRTVKQAMDLDSWLNVTRVFYLDVDDKVVTKRLIERGESSGREDDQDESIIKKRLGNYYKITEPVLNYYSDRIIKIDANKSIQKVYDQIIDNLEIEERITIIEKEYDEEDK